MDEHLDIDAIIKHCEDEIAALEKKMETNYQRGDQEAWLNAQMFLSIFKTTKERNPQTDEEHHQILRDHGWTVTKGTDHGKRQEEVSEEEGTREASTQADPHSA